MANYPAGAAPRNMSTVNTFSMGKYNDANRIAATKKDSTTTCVFLGATASSEVMTLRQSQAFLEHEPYEPDEPDPTFWTAAESLPSAGVGMM